MTNERFNEIINEMLEHSKKTLYKKTSEYDLGCDRLASFKHGAAITTETSEQVLLGYMTKHITSIIDMINSKQIFPRDRWVEKIGDTINYLILLLGLLEDMKKLKEENKE